MIEISTLGLSQKAYFYNYWNEACRIYPLSSDRDSEVKKGGIVGLRRKNKREGGIWEPSVVDPLTSSRIY